MAKPPNIPTLRESELGIKDGPVNGPELREAFRRFFAQMNAPFDLTNKSLSKGVTLVDNLRCDVVNGVFTHGVAQLVALHTLTQAKSALILGADGQLPLVAAVQMVQRTTQPKPLANVTVWFNDSTAANVKCTVALLPDGQQTSTTPTFLEALPKSGDATWVTMTPLLNSYTSTRTPGYRKDPDGTIHLRGTVTGGLADTIFTLPAGYWPSRANLFATDHNGAFGRIQVDTSGNILSDVGGHTAVVLDGITFDTR